MNKKIKEYKDILTKKETQIIKESYLYCAKNGIEFGPKHNVLMRNAMRQFFKEGVAPLVREIYDAGFKKYTDE
jgi:hypothetical protein